MEGELNTLKDNENSELQAKDSELQAKDSQLQAKIAEINALQGELNTLKEKSSDLHAQHLKLKNDFDSMKNQPSGQLPDLDPGTVSIRQPALNGTGNFFRNDDFDNSCPLFCQLFKLILKGCEYFSFYFDHVPKFAPGFSKK